MKIVGELRPTFVSISTKLILILFFSISEMFDKFYYSKLCLDSYLELEVRSCNINSVGHYISPQCTGLIML